MHTYVVNKGACMVKIFRTIRAHTIIQYEHLPMEVSLAEYIALSIYSRSFWSGQPSLYSQYVLFNTYTTKDYSMVTQARETGGKEFKNLEGIHLYSL